MVSAMAVGLEPMSSWMWAVAIITRPQVVVWLYMDKNTLTIIHTDEEKERKRNERQEKKKRRETKENK